MMRTFDEAREIVALQFGSLWGGTEGTFYVDTRGAEDDESYLVEWGAREWLVDRDLDFMLLNNLATFVVKATGAVVTEIYTTQIARIDLMRVVKGSTHVETD